MNNKKKVREFTSKTLEKILKETENDPWYIKLKRWYNLQKWLIICHTKKYWDKTYEN